MKAAILSIILVSAVLVGSCLGWDGNRKGFILGIGAGAGLTSYTQTVSITGYGEATSDRENSIGFQTDFKLGYAPNEQVQIYWMSRVSWFGMENAANEDVTITSGVAGLGLSYYLKPVTPSAYLVAGIGYSTWDAIFEDSEGWLGMGFSAGVGYEFSKHWSAEFTLNYGNPSYEELDVEAQTNALSVRGTINVLGY